MSIQVRQTQFTSSGNGEDLYRRITNSQGNIAQVEAGSTRYAATSTILSGGSGSLSSSSRSEDWDEEDMGPGSSGSNYVEDSQISGPTVEDVSISEQYHEDFNIYEESLNDNQFFYASVSNGGITDLPVSVELPAGMDYVLFKDGVEIPYTSGQKVREHGSYMLKITVTDDDSVPFKEQNVYKATFRFRIQDRPEPVTEAAVETFRPSGGTTQQEEQGPVYDELPLLQETEAVPETDPVSALEEETELNMEVMGDNDVIDSDALDQVLDQALGEGYSTESLKGYNAGTGVASEYDSDMGYYRHELASGEVFYTDVPNGILTNHSVILRTNDKLPFRILKDGEEITWEPGTAIGEPGSYLVFPYSESTVYLATYAGKQEPLFHFRIVDGPVSDLGIVTAPQNGRIAEITCNDEPVEITSPDGQWCVLQADGKYKVQFETESGTETAEFEKDTAAPRFSYSIQGGKAEFTYRSADAVRCRIVKDGTVTHDGGLLRDLDEPGNYRVEVYDAAGNYTAGSLELQYQMNMAGMAVIGLVILLVVAFVVFVQRIKKQMKVI